MTPEISGELQRESTALIEAKSYIVNTPDLALAANEELKAIKQRIAKVAELKAGFVAPAKQIIASAEAFFNPALEALAGAEIYLKGELTRFSDEQKRLVDEARKKQEAELRAARQKAEAEAAAARAKAEQEAKELARQAQEAEAARAKAESEGNAKEAAKRAAEAAKREEEARITRADGERKAAQLELAAAAVAPTITVPEPTKLAGFSTRDNWKAEFADDFDADKVRVAIIAAIAGVPAANFPRSDLVPLLEYDAKAGDKLAKALKKSMNVPGLVAANRSVASSRS